MLARACAVVGGDSEERAALLLDVAKLFAALAAAAEHTHTHVTHTRDTHDSHLTRDTHTRDTHVTHLTHDCNRDRYVPHSFSLPVRTLSIPHGHCMFPV